ncbi:MAG TPA: DUF169 domain-containing protein [Armatimonadota bacterium]|nr:DUF169 domain-containing protein [Armatimonadota bacterium]
MGHSDGIQTLLGLQWPPIALSFRESAPADVPHIGEKAAAGCGYWKLAAEGAVFYTEATDHYGCPVGAHTHGVDLPPDVAKELEGLIGVMTDLQYLTLDEIPAIPRRAEPFRVAVYAPLAEAPCDPDVVLLRGNARQIMLVTEAANAAGGGPESAAMGRPACSVIPETLRSGRSATSLGCAGNRVYTGLPDDEFYFAIPGAKVDAVAEKLAVLVRANEELTRFHQARRDAAPGAAAA